MMSEETDSANIVSHRDGEYCDNCGKLPVDSSLLEVKKDDDDSSTGNISRKFCMGCINREISGLCKKEEEQAIQNSGYENEIQIGKKREPKFRRYIFDELKKKNMKWEYFDAVYSGAEAVGLSPKTTRKYLDKLCSSEGILKKIDEGKKSYVIFKLDKLMLEKQFQDLTGDSN